MSEDRYNYEEIGKYLCKSNIRVGTAILADSEESLLKEIQKAVNTGIQHIEIGSLDKNNAARSFGFSSSVVSEIRQINKLSAVSFSVHASPYSNISGYNNRGFSPEERSQAIREVKAAIDFACKINAKILVIHPNSFPKSLSDIEPGVFRAETMEIYYLVDPATEALVGAISEQDRVYMPQQAKDSRGRPMWLEDRNRKPILDSVTGQPIPRLVTDENGRLRGEEITFVEYSRRMKKSGKSRKEVKKGFVHLRRTAEINSAYLRLLEAERTLSDAQARRDKLQDTLDYCRSLIKSSHQEIWQHERSIPDRLSSLGIPVPQDTRSIISLLEDELAHNQRIIESGRQALTTGWPQFSNIVRELGEIEPIEEYGMKVLTEAIAEIAEYCINASRQNPIRLALENLPQPQMYGSHISALLEIIEQSRIKLAKRLQKKDYGTSESNRLAKETIGATLDIGHLVLFRQLWQGSAFNKWLLSQVKDLARAGVIYNLHLSDNHGLDDSHLLLGEGNAPIKEVLGILADNDYRGYVVVEAGGARATRHTLDKFGILPMATDDELMRGFTPRQSFGGLFSKDDPERPMFGKDE